MTATARDTASSLRNFVNGEFVDSGGGAVSDVADPSTGEVYAHAPVSTAADVDAALRAAAAAYTRIKHVMSYIGE